jgi:DNA polymerase-3 subunit epsilon
VVSHFTGLNTGKKRQEFLRNICSVTFQECATEFIAGIFESVEIKRLWPVYNVSQKRPEQLFGIYTFEDGRGYKRLAIDKKRKYFEPVVSFNLLADAYRTLWKLVRQHELHPALCFLDKTRNMDHSFPEKEEYNSRVANALSDLASHLGTYAIFEPAVYSSNYGCVLVENGKFYGIGSIPENVNITELDRLKKHITQYPENEVIKSMVRSYAQRYPSKVLLIE